MKGPANWKKESVAKIADTLKEYSTIAVINMSELPSMQLQKIRGKIRNDAKIVMARRKILLHAIDISNKKELSNILPYMTEMAALLVSNKNAFELFKLIKQNMSSAPAKAGQKAPYDISVLKGPTPFAPGPMISEFGKFGVKTAIEGGKINVKEDKIIVKEGGEISPDLASLLGKLGITPMKVGINLVCALENNFLYLKNILDINEEEFVENIKAAYIEALKLSIGTGTITPESAPYLIKNAYLDAKKLGIGAEILADETKGFLLMKAEAQINALKSKLNI